MTPPHRDALIAALRQARIAADKDSNDAEIQAWQEVGDIVDDLLKEDAEPKLIIYLTGDESMSGIAERVQEVLTGIKAGLDNEFRWLWELRR